MPTVHALLCKLGSVKSGLSHAFILYLSNKDDLLHCSFQKDHLEDFPLALYMCVCVMWGGINFKVFKVQCFILNPICLGKAKSNCFSLHAQLLRDLHGGETNYPPYHNITLCFNVVITVYKNAEPT